MTIYFVGTNWEHPKQKTEYKGQLFTVHAEAMDAARQRAADLKELQYVFTYYTRAYFIAGVLHEWAHIELGPDKVERVPYLPNSEADP